MEPDIDHVLAFLYFLDYNLIHFCDVFKENTISVIRTYKNFSFPFIYQQINISIL